MAIPSLWPYTNTDSDPGPDSDPDYDPDPYFDPGADADA